VTRRRKPREEVSAGGIVFRRDGERTFFLLIRDSYRNWGSPKGHLEAGGLATLELRAPIETIDWNFRFRGRLIHKTCHFFLIETLDRRTAPQRAEGITACRWASYEQAVRMLSYENARGVLEQAQALVVGSPSTPQPHA
jgi:hypothetical protein